MSNEQRIEGARLIEEEIRKTFSSNGKEVSTIQWNLNSGGSLFSVDSHTIHVTVNGRTLTLTSLPSETIEDYPGGLGNERLIAHIRELASQ